MRADPNSTFDWLEADDRRKFSQGKFRIGPMSSASFIGTEGQHLGAKERWMPRPLTFNSQSKAKATKETLKKRKLKKIMLIEDGNLQGGKLTLTALEEHHSANRVGSRL